MSDRPVIHWFRRDLRLTDNTALREAHSTGKPVVTAFCFDDSILDSDYVGAPKVAFLLKAVDELQTAVWKAGGRLVILRGNPLKAIPQLVEETQAEALFFNHDYTPYAKKRDEALTEQLEIPVHGFHDALMMPPGEVMTNAGDPYSVYTPFKNKWRNKFTDADAEVLSKVESHLYRVQDVTSIDLPTLDALGYDKLHPTPDASEDYAQQCLQTFVDSPIYDYAEERNQLTIDPFQNYPERPTAELSPYFRLGLLSPRQAYTAAQQAKDSTRSNDKQAGVDTWVDELIWREFYMHVMAHYPHVYSGNYNTQYDDLNWEDNAEGLQRWKDGETGYPIVDAAMRQLKAVGWLPNRARMFVASFLCKDQLIHWQAGEEHFMQYLVDGDPAANNGGWQWAAGTGTDAQPYFRIFNPISQSTKHDPNGEYIRHWVPELADIQGDEVHEPWKMDKPPKDYPEPIVDHKEARERTLAAFKEARDN